MYFYLKQNKKRIISTFLTLCLILSMNPFMSYGQPNNSTIVGINDNDLSISTNGQQQNLDIAPYLNNGELIVPVSHVARALGADVRWNGKEKIVTIFYNNDEITIQIGNKTLKKNGTYFLEMDFPAELLNNGEGLYRTMLPATALAKIMDIGYSEPINKEAAYFKEYADGEEIVGWVHAGESISETTLSVYDLENNLLYQSENGVTNEFGAFIRGAITDIPTNFRITAKNGNIAGEIFNYTLSADYENFDSKKDVIYINTITTMISAYKDANPETSIQDATSVVREFLEIPDGVNIYQPVSNDYFNENQFFLQAEQNGGINEYIDQLLSIMDKESLPFKSSLTKGATSFIAENLAKGAVSYVGGELMGWGLKSIGVDLSGDHTAEQIAEINKGLSEMQSEMKQISTELVKIEGKLDTIISGIRELSHKIDMSGYDTRIGQMENLISAISQLRRDLTYYVTNPPTANLDSQRERLVNRIENNIIDSSSLIHNQLTGVSGQKPLLELWTEIVYQNSYLDADDYEKIETQFEYFRKLQEYILVLQVEYYHAIESEDGDSYNKVMDCIKAYEDNIKKQRELLPLPIPQDTVIYTQQHLMFYSEDIVIGKTTNPTPGIDEGVISNKLIELTNSNYAGFKDWKKMDPFTIDFLKFNHATDKEEWYLSDFLVSRGWPGEGVKKVPLYIPYFGFTGKTIKLLISDKYFNEIALLPTLSDVWIMTYRVVKAKDYGYNHLIGN